MIQISTSNLLVLRTYGETNADQNRQIAQDTASNQELNQLRNELMEAKHQLNTIRRSPSETSLRIIMEHSYKTEHLQEI